MRKLNSGHTLGTSYLHGFFSKATSRVLLKSCALFFVSQEYEAWGGVRKAVKIIFFRHKKCRKINDPAALFVIES
jgi:hypothetical protein